MKETSGSDEATVTETAEDGDTVSSTESASATTTETTESVPNYNLSTINPSLQWGPYRPSHYLGIRPLVSSSLLMGLMWANASSDINTLNEKLRDRIETNDNAIYWGWQSYNTRYGGTQLVYDYSNYLNLTMQMVKYPFAPGNSSGHWAVRVSGAPTDSDERRKTHLVWHIAMENMTTDEITGKNLMCNTKYGRLVCDGFHPILDQFDIRLVPLDGNRLAEMPKILSVQAAEEDIWKAKNIYLSRLNGTLKQDSSTYGLHKPGSGNIHFLQLVFTGSFTFDIIYTSKRFQVPFNSTTITSAIVRNSPMFHSNFENVFDIKSPFTTEQHGGFCRWLLSNVFAGLGYYEGKLILSSTSTSNNGQDAPSVAPPISDFKTLFSFTPSRIRLAQGFLWHEGFHLLLAAEWDLDLAIDVLHSWLSNMHSNGWIASRQLLGDETREGFSDADQTQELDVAAPPSLLALALPKIIDKLNGTEDYKGEFSFYQSNATGTMLQLYPLLTKYYYWFRDNQKGNMDNYGGNSLDPKVQGYRWRGCADAKCAASGLEDYPRPDPEEPEGALHVDALSWLGAAAQAMARAADLANMTQDVANYTEDLASVWETLGQIHWDEQEGVWCDTTSNVTAGWHRECRLGYVSLMPLFLNLVDPSQGRMGRVLDTLTNGSLVGTYGLASLSSEDPEFSNEDKSACGRIWVNFNVLAALRLKKLTEELDNDNWHIAASTLAMGLREKAINLVYRQWNEDPRRSIWDHYSSENGSGGVINYFTGWSALVLLLMDMVREASAIGTTTGNDEDSGVNDGSDTTESTDITGGSGTSEGEEEALDSLEQKVRDGYKFDLNAFTLAMGAVVILIFSRRYILKLWRKIWGHDKREQERWEMLRLGIQRATSGLDSGAGGEQGSDGGGAASTSVALRMETGSMHSNSRIPSARRWDNMDFDHNQDHIHHGYAYNSYGDQNHPYNHGHDDINKPHDATTLPLRRWDTASFSIKHGGPNVNGDNYEQQYGYVGDHFQQAPELRHSPHQHTDPLPCYSRPIQSSSPLSLARLAREGDIPATSFTKNVKGKEREQDNGNPIRSYEEGKEEMMGSPATVAGPSGYNNGSVCDPNGGIDATMPKHNSSAMPETASAPTTGLVTEDNNTGFSDVSKSGENLEQDSTTAAGPSGNTSTSKPGHLNL